jgi:hypothetical protein
MSRLKISRRVTAGIVAILAAATLVSGCSTTVEGTAKKEGSGDVGRNEDSQKKYPNLLKECDVLTEDILAKTVEADPLDIQGTFVGAICRWHALNPTGLVDITRFWFEHGSLDNERKVAEFLNYKVESRRIKGIDSIVMKTNDPNGGCGVASDASGVVGWWVNPQTPGIDACDKAIKLMEQTLSTDS